MLEGDSTKAEALQLNSWIPTVKNVSVRITSHSLTGRRIENGTFDTRSGEVTLLN